MLQKILLCFIITCFSFPVAKGGVFSLHCSLELCVFMYSLFKCSVCKKSEVPYVLNCGESVGVYCSILRNCLHNGSTHYIFLY
jgi:hypothetical protein